MFDGVAAPEDLARFFVLDADDYDLVSRRCKEASRLGSAVQCARCEPAELLPAGGSRWLRNRGGLGLRVGVLPVDGGAGEIGADR